MTGFLKPLMLAGFAAGSVSLAAQDVPPTPPPPPAAPPLPDIATFPKGGRIAVGGVGGQAGGFFGPEGLFGPGGPARPFGDDPQLRTLAKKLADAKDDEAKDKFRGELKAALAKAFDDRQKGQEKQVEELEKQLKRLKETISKRKEAKAEIIADRMTALEKEAKGLGW